ncbi:MAG TPA: glutamate 5-kinase [Syntrophales bacterium]|jgi:glutamate 5-kinase|nr:glutamate 5-kinase [Syntrophales bacterium]HRT61618.1 glutamate 5-kinase [Syntrophales bacterium]
MSQIRKQIVTNVKKALIKIGTGVLAGADGLDLNIVEQLVDEMVQLRSKGIQIVIVTSGAIASGKHRMGITGKLKSMPQKQACAAIGQGRLMRIYSNAFGKHSVYVAQILLTMSDLTDRTRFINVRNTLSTLMDWNVVPIINENDTVSVDEIKFGDNDHLAAMIANIIQADILINLTNTEGLFDRNPAGKQRARLIKLVHEITDEIESMATAEADPLGMGGMRSKVIAAQKVTACGIPYIIARGKTKGILADVFGGREKGTLFLPSPQPLTSREYWIAFTLKSRGKLFLDDGAKNAIVNQGKSLLPSGIIRVEGDFNVGDPVICIGTDGKVFAKGLVNFNSADIQKIQGLKTTKIEQVLGRKDYDEVIHRDNMAVAKGSRKA